MEKLSQNKEKAIGAVLFVLYLVFNGILLAGHELWRDEANVWLFARDTTPIQLLSEIKYQGHPCLWYFIVMPVAKLGLPFPVMSIMSYLVMAAAAGLFVWKAPFHPVTKLACLFSPLFSYYYAVVARNYCLIALFLMALAWWYPKRKEKPVRYGLLLGLLVQADTIAIAPAGLISLMWLWESVSDSIKEKTVRPVLVAAKGLWIPLLSLLFWMLQFYQVSDSPEYQMRILSVKEMLSEIRNFAYHILIRMTGQTDKFCFLFFLLFAVVCILFACRTKDLWPAVVAAGAFLFEIVFSIMVYQLHIWHYIMLGFVLIWCFWNYGGRVLEAPDKRSKAARVLSEVLLLLLAVTMFGRWNAPEESSSLKNAWNGLYSDAVHVAEYMKKDVGKEALVLTTDVIEATTVQAYLGKDYTHYFYFAGTGQKLTYANYTEEEKTQITYGELLDKIRTDFPERDVFYLLVSPTSCISDLKEQVSEEWELCYRTEEKTARGEAYTLYRINMQE